VQPLKWQRNAIYESVVAGGLHAAECTFDYNGDEWRISHVPSASHFLIRGDPLRYNLTAVVGENPPWPSESSSWVTVPDKVQRWAEEVRRDVDTPDLWAELRHTREILTSAGNEAGDNTPFSPSEQTEILEKLREIKEFVKRSDSLSEARWLSVEARLDVLAAAAAQAGRRDWQLMFGGVVLGMIMQQVLPNDIVWDIMRIVGDGLGHLFGGDGPPPLPPAPPPVV
jgi:hypothetical protein